MHDVFRKTAGPQALVKAVEVWRRESEATLDLPQVVAATIGVVIWKLFGGMLFESSSVGGETYHQPVFVEGVAFGTTCAASA